MATKNRPTAKRRRKTVKSTTKANVNRVVKRLKSTIRPRILKITKTLLRRGLPHRRKARAERQIKNKNVFRNFTVILIAAIVFVAVYGYFKGWFDPILIGDNTLDFNSDTYDVTAIKSENLSIHFLELGNGYTGDCVYIKAGETDVLIDAGSRPGSAAAIAAYVDRYCEDNTLEYVIATHAHQDHIAGFVGTKDAQGIFDKYECKTIIEFARTNATSEIYKNYCEKRNEEAERGANCYTALECVNNSNGLKRFTI